MKLARLKGKLTYSNVIASMALFVALGGVAAAAGLGKNSVGTQQLKPNAVTAAKIKNGAINSHKLGHNSVVAGKIAGNTIAAGNLQNGSVTSSKLGKNSVTNAAIANGVVGTNKLGNNVVTTAKLADGSVTPAKLSGELSGSTGPLKSGQTLRGVFDLGGTGAVGDLARGAVSYQFPISGNPPAVTVLKKGQISANCAGIGTGSAPAATAGNLCIYLTEEKNLDPATGLVAENNTRLGFGLVAKSETASEYVAYGQWAVTAP